MSILTPKLGFELWEPGDSEYYIPNNDNLNMWDQIGAGGVISRTTDAQPGSPAAGDTYIMTASASGAAWGGFSAGNIADFRGGVWAEWTPWGRMRMFVDDESTPTSPVMIAWDGAAWRDVIQSVVKYPGQNLQTGTTYELVLGDAGFPVDMNNASPNTVNIPDNSSVDFPVNVRIDIVQYGVGLTTVACPGSDVLRGDPVSLGQYKMMGLWHRAATEWLVIGGTT